MILLAQIALGLAALPAAMVLINLLLYRRLPGHRASAPISVLIPARDEAANIRAAIESVLANRHPAVEVIVLDDGSSDATPDLVRAFAAGDPRVRLERAPPLPAGWSGKQYACQVLSTLACHPLMLFMDADVRLAPDALERMAHLMTTRPVGLASGIPRQRTVTVTEKLVIPVIHLLLLGYLPMPLMRLFRWPGLGAGCGQLMLVRREAYRIAGGHAAIRASLHDGIKLPRAFRARGIDTWLFDATDVATCRMYAGAGEVWRGFAKNATEGMATAVGLPLWTMLLGGGHVLPFVLLAAAPFAPAGSTVAGFAALAAALGLGVRLVLAARFRQSLLGVLAHPAGIVATLAIQFYAFGRSRSGRGASWRGRTYCA